MPWGCEKGSSMQRLMLTLVGPMIALAGGCAMDSPRMEQRVVLAATPEEVLPAAATVLEREFGRVRVDSAGLRVTAGPEEYVARGSTGLARDLVGGRATMRRTATFVAARSSEGTVARLRVERERRDSGAVAPSTANNWYSDSPGYAPTFTGPAGDELVLWTPVGRDRKLEDQLLDELREQVARAAPAEAAPPEPPVVPPPPPATQPAP